MKLEKSLLRGLLILAVICQVSCRLKPPKQELCIIGDRGCICYDERKDPKEYMLTFDECRNYIATNPDDYASTMKWLQKNCWGPR